ncbi:Unknown protein [Striga hermonthica]|uniref:Uncharacterized protein n=1 Tax=Striga hermonthica TaxID=68872 RepID=A0A9N7R7H0_STRHE|nr:Unknown protein [Striga hermonthica]
MGRGRTKGKKLLNGNQDDPNSGEEEKIPAQRKRGRPQKSPKDEKDEINEAQKQEDEEDSEDTKSVTGQNGKRQKRNGPVKENDELVKDDNVNGNGRGPCNEVSTKSNGFRHSGSRRKNKPRRAAEAVIECN